MYDAVIGTHDSSAVFAAIIAQETGKRFAPVKAIINCQNKYLCRRIQEKVIPEHTPNYFLALDYLREPAALSVPFFIKPVRSNISFGTHRISEPSHLEYYIARESIDIARFNQYYLDALTHSTSYHNGLNIACCNSFLCEDFIEGTQVTVDGYVFDKNVHFFGVTRAVYHENSNSFFYHAFPSPFSSEIQDKIEAALKKLIPALGIDNSFFNVELRVDEEQRTFKIIEVNSRIAFQFAKTIEAVTGFDPLSMLCDVAVGKKPDHSSIKTTLYNYCYNFELHHFSDAKILETPTQSAIEEIRIKYPEVFVRNLIHENASLSDFKHNPQSFRYGVVDIPGNSHDEIMAKYEDVLKMLGYKFINIEQPDKATPFIPDSPPPRAKGQSYQFTTQPQVSNNE